MAKNWNEMYRNLDSLTPEDREEIGLKVKIVGEIIAARKDIGITQAELEQITGIKQPMIARLENNGNDPQLSTILKLLRPLGMTLGVVPISAPGNAEKPGNAI